MNGCNMIMTKYAKNAIDICNAYECVISEE